jgi:feruloyl-CoA synthase
VADDVSSLTGQEPGGTVRSTPVMSVFARPRIAMQEREDGCLLLRSADPLQDYPGTIVHSLWAWAVADPDYPLVAQRDADGSWRACSYGTAVAAAAAIGQALLRKFFARLRLLFNAAAALPSGLRDWLRDLAAQASGRSIPVTGSWGTTETAPAVTTANFDHTDARCIGAPLPGTQVKLAPAEDAYEIRVKGPIVTPGYYDRPDLTAEAFDDEGFYRSGDAATLANPADPNAGLVFRGRIAEDFKLITGTFVRVGAVRTALLSAAPILADAVIAGEGRDHLCALAWLNLAEARTLTGADIQIEGEFVVNEALHKALAHWLADHNETAGSAARIERLAVLVRPADLDFGEITDKGYVNQRQVLKNRSALIELLYADPPPAHVIIPETTR